jgi:hypothetical protein
MKHLHPRDQRSRSYGDPKGFRDHLVKKEPSRPPKTSVYKAVCRNPWGLSEFSDWILQQQKDEEEKP